MKKRKIQLKRLNLNKEVISSIQSSNIIGGGTFITECEGCQYSMRCDSRYMCESIWCAPKPVSNACGSYDIVCGATLTTCESNGCPVTK